MKKIMFLLLMILTLSLAACSNEYERLYNLDNDIKLVEIFSEEQAKEYLEEVKKVLEKIDYITYEGEQYCTDISLLDPRWDHSQTKHKTFAKFQRKGDIRFIFQMSGTRENNGDVEKTKYEYYGKDGNIYYNHGEHKSYICNQYYDATAMIFFYRETLLGALNPYYSDRHTYGIDDNGNIICYEKSEYSIFIRVYNNYKLEYAEWRRLKDGEIFFCEKENFSYNYFFEIKEDLSSYEHQDYSCPSCN